MDENGCCVSGNKEQDSIHKRIHTNRKPLDLSFFRTLLRCVEWVTHARFLGGDGDHIETGRIRALLPLLAR